MAETSQKHKENGHLLWDCGSTLYDSHELSTFNRQLDSAIASRTFSMPRLSDHRVLPPPPVLKKSSKISRSLHKLLRSVFKIKTKRSIFGGQAGEPKDGFYVVYDKEGGLTTSPEVPKVNFGGTISPEMCSVVRKSASERFNSRSIGISCA